MRTVAAGPTFELRPAEAHDLKADIQLRVVGVRAGSWSTPVGRRPVVLRRLGRDGPVGESLRFPPVEPGDDLTLTAHLTVEPWKGHEQVALLLLLTVESRE